MKRMQRAGRAGFTPSGQALRVSPVAAAVSTLLMTALGGQAQAQAQTQAAPVTQTVEITGIRRAIESSISTKRDSDQIVESISSEDIGKLPDVSIGESLARLPGLAGQRVGGRAQGIQIRGLSSDFSATLLNGRQQVTTGDNRAVEYDQFPSELISRVMVYKTPDAALVGQGLSGTVDMQSIRPLDYSGRRVNLNARMETNSHGSLNAGISGAGKRFSASYVDQFANRTIGVALGFAHLDSPGQEMHYKAWGFGRLNADCTANPSWGCSQATGVPAGATVQTGFEVTAVSRKQTRDGLMAVLEYKPNKDLHSTVDLYYSRFTKDETMRGLMNGLAEGWAGNPGVGYTNVTTSPVGSTSLVTAANLANTNFIVRNDLNRRTDKLLSGGWNLKARLNKDWRLGGDLAFSRAERTEDVIETYAGARAPSATDPSGSTKVFGTTGFRINSGFGFPSFTPGLNYADARSIYLSDPANDWGHDGLWKKPYTKDEIKSARVDVSRDMSGMFSRLDLGLSYVERQKDRSMNEVRAHLNNNRRPVLVPAALIQSPTSLSFAGIPGVLSYDVMGALNTLYTLTPTALNEVINRNYDVTEKVATAFARLSIDTQWGKVPVRGNLGLQVVQTDQSSRGFVKFGNVSPTNPALENTRGTSYTDVLPSLNLNFELGADTVARFGLAKTMARGRMDDMRAGADVSLAATTGLWSGSGGNPFLEPWRATSVDLSIEKYLNKRSYVAAAAFHKKLDTYIYTQRLEMDFTGVPNATAVVPRSPFGLFSRPMNGQGGKVSGVELSASLDGSLLSKKLDGVGVIANASFTDSSVSPNGPGTTQKLPGLSGTVASLTLYYEAGGFSSRISQRYRSAFRGEVTGVHNARTFTEIQADQQTDLQLSYAFGSGALKGLSVLLQVNNLTNSPYATRQGNGFGDVVAPEEYNRYGRQTLLGVSYKM